MSSNLGRQVDSVQINHVSVQNWIVDVWESNFFEELEKIKDLIAEYNYVSMDTEFPGIVNVPRSRSHDYEYQLVKINVDELKLIQLGITLFNSRGQTPQGTCTWQFNFKFDVDKEKSLRASIKVLREAGINFDMHKTSGIDKNLFGQYFITSGLVFNEDVAWIWFQGNQDFGYMYRILANTPIPDSEGEFLDDIKYYFPKLLDVKYMKHEFEELRGGLSRLGDFLSLERIGQQHQAGSDSWLTGLCFFKLANTYLQGKDILENYNLILYGLSPSVNDEAYLDNYTSVTDQLEREKIENTKKAMMIIFIVTIKVIHISIIWLDTEWSIQTKKWFQTIIQEGIYFIHHLIFLTWYMEAQCLLIQCMHMQCHQILWNIWKMETIK